MKTNANKMLRRMPLDCAKPLRLMFDPLCWLKLQFFCHCGGTEIGGFGISASEDGLYVREFTTVLQGATAVSVTFADSAVADYFDQCIDNGLRPRQFARIWLHTHPGDSPEPSGVDERTFADVFGKCDWALMFILSRTGRTYTRLSFGAVAGATVQVPVAVDWEAWPRHLAELDFAAERRRWQDEFDANIHPLAQAHWGSALGGRGVENSEIPQWDELDQWHRLLEECEQVGDHDAALGLESERDWEER